MTNASQFRVGYLYQQSSDGRTWANGFGPVENNLKITSTHRTLTDALAAGQKLIGSPSPMGVVQDAYVVKINKTGETVFVQEVR